MADRFMSLQNLKFTLNSRRSRYPDLAGDILNGCADQTLDMVFKSVQEVGNKIMHPIFEEMDRKPPTLEKGVVKVHPAVRSMLNILGKDGWIAASFPEAWGGEEMPVSILHCINSIFSIVIPMSWIKNLILSSVSISTATIPFRINDAR